MGIAITDYYFDSGDYSNPTKINVNVDENYSLLSSFKKTVTIKLRRNDVSDTKNYLPLAKTDNFSYFCVGKSIRDYSNQESDGIVLDLNIVLDDKYQTINRTVFTLTDLFGKIGGMDSMIIIIVSFIIKAISSKIYTVSLISSFYSEVSNQVSNIDFPVEEMKQNFIESKHNKGKFIYEENLKKEKSDNTSDIFSVSKSQNELKQEENHEF